MAKREVLCHLKRSFLRQWWTRSPFRVVSLRACVSLQAKLNGLALQPNLSFPVAAYDIWITHLVTVSLANRLRNVRYTFKTSSSLNIPQALFQT